MQTRRWNTENIFSIFNKRSPFFFFFLPCSSWMRLRMLVDPNGKVPVKVVARTFASGKTEKLVYQCLADLGLSSGKVLAKKRMYTAENPATHLLKYRSCFTERRHRAWRFHIRRVLRAVPQNLSEERHRGVIPVHVSAGSIIFIRHIPAIWDWFVNKRRNDMVYLHWIFSAPRAKRTLSIWNNWSRF